MNTQPWLRRFHLMTEGYDPVLKSDKDGVFEENTANSLQKTIHLGLNAHQRLATHLQRDIHLRRGLTPIDREDVHQFLR
ncbi:MAG: hypothetical protein KGZ30_01400 [Anaplasmataceae bacterium]|nr:hypothetical protein [Anaplasmataceae bacterium]